MKYFFVAVIMLLNLRSFCQEGELFISKDVLENPITNYQFFERNFFYSEIDSFRMTDLNNYFLFKNGYAKSKIINPEIIKDFSSFNQVDSIVIVFTKYPVRKSDWITNYYNLLSDRLKELFLIAPEFNNSKVKFRLLLQTNCKYEHNAKKMFHGILVFYTPQINKADVPDKKELKSELVPAKYDSSFFQNKSKEEQWQESWEEEILKSETYRKNKQSKRNRKKYKEPKCPDFKEKKRLFKRKKR